MKNYKVQKLVEQLLINSIMNKNATYIVTEHFNRTDNTYETEILNADIEDDAVWFTDDRFNFSIESVKDINISDDYIRIDFESGYKDLTLIK